MNQQGKENVSKLETWTTCHLRDNHINQEGWRGEVGGCLGLWINNKLVLLFLFKSSRASNFKFWFVLSLVLIFKKIYKMAPLSHYIMLGPQSIIIILREGWTDLTKHSLPPLILNLFLIQIFDFGWKYQKEKGVWTK